MSLDLSSVIKPYQDGIDSIIEAMGKHITLVFEETISNVSSDYNDLVRQELRKPIFKGSDSNEPTIVKNTKIIKALIEHNPKEFVNFGIRVDLPNSIIRLKTYLTDVPDISRCKYIIANSDILPILELRYRLLMEPIPKGLQVDRYAVSYWTRV